MGITAPEGERTSQAMIGAGMGILSKPNKIGKLPEQRMKEAHAMFITPRKLFPIFTAVIINTIPTAVRAVEVESGYDWIITDVGSQVELAPGQWLDLVSYPYYNQGTSVQNRL